MQYAKSGGDNQGSYRFGRHVRDLILDFLESDDVVTNNKFLPDREPLLVIDEIQGNIFPGFNKPFQM